MADTNGWNVRNVYLYLICFTTLIILIIGSVRLVMSVVDIAYPQPYYGPVVVAPRATPKNNPAGNADNAMQQDRQRFEAQTRRSNVVGLVDSLALIGIALPVYLYHWRKIQRSA